MSTNSRIGILHEDGTTETIYCHWDGYPDHQMPILAKHYDTAEKVKALLSLGDISILGERLAPEADEPHSFEKPAEGVTVAYQRDRKEPMQPALTHKSVVSLMRADWGIPYYYFSMNERKSGSHRPRIDGAGLPHVGLCAVFLR